MIKVDTEEDINLPHEGQLVSSSIHGETDALGMVDRIKRTEDFKIRYNWHVSVPCQGCSNSIEFRKFLPNGKAVTVGFYCMVGEIETEEYATCNYAHVRRNGRRRIVYDAENAPPGFAEGLAPVQMYRCFTMKEKMKAAIDSAKKMYRGGTSSYQRIDGESEAVGSGKMPRVLTN